MWKQGKRPRLTHARDDRQVGLRAGVDRVAPHLGDEHQRHERKGVVDCQREGERVGYGEGHRPRPEDPCARDSCRRSAAHGAERLDDGDRRDARVAEARRRAELRSCRPEQGEERSVSGLGRYGHQGVARLIASRGCTRILM